MVKKLIKKWLGLTELEKEYQDYSFLKNLKNILQQELMSLSMM